MKTLLLNSDDIQNFSKLIYDPKVTQLTTSAGNGDSITEDASFMALQYYLKHPGNYMNTPQTTTTTAAPAVASQVYVQRPLSSVNYAPNQINAAITTTSTIHNSSGGNNSSTQTSLPGTKGVVTSSGVSALSGLVLTNTHSNIVVTNNNQHAVPAQQHHQAHNNNQPPQHHHLLAQSQSQLKQLQLKQPTIHQHQAANYHHHPYYQHATSTHSTAVPAHHSHNTHHSHIGHHSHHSHSHSHSHSTTAATTHSHNYNVPVPGPVPVPVHALNQNSNFSAASSSTGGGTASSHAPTQQSNTTGSSLSPPGASASARTTPASSNSNTSSSSSSNSATGIRSSTGNATKKLKSEPILSQFHQTERLTFANAHINWNEDHWKRVVFQDERKFNLDGPDGFSYYFHDLRNYERSLSQRPRGNSVFIYIVISAGGAIYMDVSMAKFKTETCIETILRERGTIVNKLGGNTEYMLQDHNWTTNAMPSVQEWLNAEGVKLQKWPTIAHDLNIMEGVWGWLIREVFDGGRKFSRKDDLIFRIREAWSRLPLELISNLYTTLPERITQLYYTRGAYTNC
ncbi:flocculation protein FLO11 [Glossina fuscipes]|uniref:Flocculation protein FLO11 n=1 Tax=Glossina fuscipes TaxID=7396 RepID=A0A9C5ZJF7_9MUSC|nr:flocculation protein FLO11 [Glossina fuscipes]